MKHYYDSVVKKWHLLLLTFGLCASFQIYATAQQTTPSPGSNLPAVQEVKGHNNLRKLSQLYDKQHSNEAAKPPAIGDNAQLRYEYEYELLRDPKTKQIPKDIRNKELRYAQRNGKRTGMAGSASRMTTPWQARGPYNVGGRTRALAIDQSNENVILAGGVSGGLWRSTDGGQSWQKATGSNEIQSITAIAQDPRPGYQNIWYYGTGERIGNSASGGGAFFGGNGVYKSTDGGASWALLSSTADNDPTSNTPFDIIFNLAVNPNNGDLFVATWSGVHRSTNGGTSFSLVINSGGDRWTDITITPEGIMYVAVDGRAPNSGGGIYRSVDGLNWINITPATFPVSFGRTVLGYSPSNPNVVYAFTDNLLNSTGFLWRYTHNAGAATINEQWANLTANLPNSSIGGTVGNLNTQTGYNMLVKVHPTKPNVVFVGGTNLYRSTTGFTTPARQESWIGGYATLNNVSMYPNQHPDQHALVFYPSNPDKALSGNDGGVMLANNITSANAGSQPVVWQSLNNGYLTTQPYTVSINPSGTDDILLSGFQDNGSWITTTSTLTSPWQDMFSGDGSYNAIADNGKTRYVSSQSGNIYRFNYASATDNADDFLSFSRVTPAGASGFAFITPFILDPNDDNVMYLAAGGTIWRNSNLDGLPIFTNALPTAGWKSLTNSQVPAGERVTALSVSRVTANRLYYGTNLGKIYRIDNANFGDQQKVDISSGKGLPAGFVNNITIDPTNADRVFVVMSNYRVPSIFYSENGGESWTDISGNLEQNSDGSGNGPSVRWLAIKGNSDGYFVGTSTGLYSATTLAGKNTVWAQEDINGIGNVVIPMIQSRQDGFIAVATHGNGLYSGRFEVSPLPEPSLSIVNSIDDFSVFVNSAKRIIDVSNVFSYTGNLELKLSVLNDSPEKVNATLQGNLLVLEFMPNTNGEAAVALVATAGTEQLSEPFIIKIDPLSNNVYSQNGSIVGSRPSQLFTDFNNGLAQSADDFVVPTGQTWTIEQVRVMGGANGAPTFTDVRVIIYQNNGGKPGAIVYNSDTIVSAAGPSNANFVLNLPTPTTLAEGTYWISVFPVLPFSPGNRQWFWSTQSAINGSETMFRDPLNIYGRGAINWTSGSATFRNSPVDHIFTLSGTVLGAPAPLAPTELMASYKTPLQFELNWKDNASNELAYLIERSTDGSNFKHYTLVAPNQQQYLDTDFFDPALTYYYRVAAVGISENSAFSNIDSTAVIPQPPVVLPAANVHPTLGFTARWETTVGARYYLLDISLDNFQTFVNGHENRRVSSTSYALSNTIANAQYQYRVRAVNAGGISEYSQTMIVGKTEALVLNPICSENPALNRQWQVSNPNPFPVNIKWQVVGTNQRGALLAQPGLSNFTTTTIGGTNTTLISWTDDKGKTKVSVKASIESTCTTGTAMADGNSVDKQEGIANSFIFNVWPNPTADKFTALIATPKEGNVSLEIINNVGVKIMQLTTQSNSMQMLDLSRFPAGLYIIRIQQGEYTEQVRLIKQ